MLRSDRLQPDQNPAAWDNHVLVYEAVFEPFTLAFAQAAIAALGPVHGQRVIDVAAGPGGAALALARQGASVVAIDGAAHMVRRISERAKDAGLTIEAAVMDGTRLAFPPASFDAGLSIFGVILFPDAAEGLREMARVVRPGGRIAVVTWTQPHNYELASLLRASAADIMGPSQPAPLPAQLRFVDQQHFEALFQVAGIGNLTIASIGAALRAPTVDWLIERLTFAPGMESLIQGFGGRRLDVIELFRQRLLARFGHGEVSLGGVASLGVGAVGHGQKH